MLNFWYYVNWILNNTSKIFINLVIISIFDMWIIFVSNNDLKVNVHWTQKWMFILFIIWKDLSNLYKRFPENCTQCRLQNIVTNDYLYNISTFDYLTRFFILRILNTFESIGLVSLLPGLGHKNPIFFSSIYWTNK